MPIVDFYTFIREAEERRRELGLEETPAMAEAMRNRGGERTPEKREFLRRIEARAKAAGIQPDPSYY